LKRAQCVEGEEDLEALFATPNENGDASGSKRPNILSVSDVLALDVPPPSLLIENLLPAAGATLIFGAPKSNKTLVAIQAGIAVASAHSFLDFYRVLEPGPVLLVEQDDPAGAASVKTILQRSPVPVAEIPFFLAPRVPFSFGEQFIEWLEGEIVLRKLRLCILDSYTALRGPRGSGVDIVKAEQSDLTMLDELGKRTDCALLIIHHASKGSASLDWSDRAAGTFAMSAATEAQIHLSRFADLDTNAPERLVRIRGRHLEGIEMVLRFRKDTLDHEHVLEGGAAPYFPLLLQMRAAFGAQSFGAKELSHVTGVSRATAHRQIDRLFRSGALTKRGFGEYVADGVRF
jgi:AAA domain